MQTLSSFDITKLLEENTQINSIFDEALTKIFNILQTWKPFEDIGFPISNKTYYLDRVKHEFTLLIQKDSENLAYFGKFRLGEYDEIAFGDSPQITKEVDCILQNFNREFVLRLFCMSKSMKTLIFWFEESKRAKLPKNSLLLAVVMGCNVHVLKFLRNKEPFNGINPLEKNELRMRGKRFIGGEGYEFLLKELEF